MNIVTIIGARPQFIKAATISRAVASRDDIDEVIVHTGQHYDANMSDIFFEQMDIPKPDYHLGVGGGLHGAMTGRQLEKIEEVLIAEKPDWVLVYGDTNSTLAGSLAAAKLHIPVAHVEAGLRSFNRRMPEEINRVLTDHVSTLLFAPTDIAKTNLLAEGIDEASVHVVGDVMYDAAVFYKVRAVKPEWFDDLDVSEGGYALCTIHRAENTDDPATLAALVSAINVISEEINIVMPLHPRTRQALKRHGLGSIHATLLSPVGYLDMLFLLENSRYVITDSGGLQKEAFFFSKPCLTLRKETEWIELVDAGVNYLGGVEYEGIIAAWGCMKSRRHNFVKNLYGSGDASIKVVDALYG